MRAAFQILFVSFYLLSSYATTQHRVSFVVHNVKHSNSQGSDTSLEQGGHHRVHYTRFRDAKKVGLDLNFVVVVVPALFPIVTERGFSIHAPTLHFSVHFRQFPFQSAASGVASVRS